MIDVWSHFITGCHCFLLQLQLPFSHMPRLSRTHQSGGHHEKTHGRKVTRSTGEPFGNLLEGHRRFLFRYFGGFHSWHLQWTAGLLPNRSSTPHGPKKKGTQLRFFLLGPSLEKKMHFPFWRLPPFLCSTHPFFWEKNPNLPPRKVRKKKNSFSLWDPWGESTPSLVEKKSFLGGSGYLGYVDSNQGFFTSISGAHIMSPNPRVILLSILHL